MEPLQKAESLFRPWELEVKLRNELERENSEIGNKQNSPHKEGCRLREGPKTMPASRHQYCYKRAVRRASDSEVDTLPLKKPRYEYSNQNPRTKSLPSHTHNYGLPINQIPRVPTTVGPFNPRLPLPSSLFTDPRHHSRIPRLTPTPESLPSSPLVDALASGPPESARRKRPKDKLCPKCPNTFSNQAQLDAHLRGHFNVRNYACDYAVDGDTKKCDKRFVRKEELTRHQRTHTGEKPHLCRMCGKGFGRKDHLQKHEKTHEKTGPPQQFPFPGHHPPSFLLHPPIGRMPPYPLFPLHHSELQPRMPPPGYMLNLLAYPQLLPLGLGGDGLLRSVSAGFPSRAVRSPKADPELA